MFQALSFHLWNFILEKFPQNVFRIQKVAVKIPQYSGQVQKARSCKSDCSATYPWQRMRWSRNIIGLIASNILPVCEWLSMKRPKHTFVTSLIAVESLRGLERQARILGQWLTRWTLQLSPKSLAAWYFDWRLRHDVKPHTTGHNARNASPASEWHKYYVLLAVNDVCVIHLF